MRVGRNDPCPCGSGKKYKACCQAADRARAELAETVGPEVLAAAEAEWREIARREPVWEIDAVPIPIPLSDVPEGSPSLAVVAAAGFVVHGEVVRRSARGLAGRARAVADALSAAARQMGVLPERLRVRDEALAAALRETLGEKAVEVEAAEMPGLDEALAGALEHIAESAVRARLSIPSTWADTEASPAVLAELHAAAAEFYRAAPWDEVGDVPAFLVFPDQDVWMASVMGEAGMEFGLVLYSEPRDLLELLASEGEDGPEAHFASMAGHSLALNFGPRGELSKAMRKEVDAAGWPVAGRDAYPHVYGMRLPEWRVTERQLERVALALRTVTIAARGDDPHPVTGVRVFPLPDEPPLSWPVSPEAEPIAAEGPGADPHSALRGWDDEEAIAAAEEERAARVEEWLARCDEVEPAAMPHDAFNARAWAEFLGLHGVPAGAVTELDLRVFVYDHYHDAARASDEATERLPRSLSLVFRFLEESEGIRYPFAARVLGELEQVAREAAEEGTPLDEVLRVAGSALYADLRLRGLLPDEEIPGTEEGWPLEMEPEVARLHHELQRRWLLWHDEAVRAGTTDRGELRELLLARQRAWESAPHPEHGGRTPADVVRGQEAVTSG